MSIIYLATNRITGKQYIGYTQQSFHKRKIAHKTKSKNGSKLYFHNAIRKYGWENFDWQMIYEGDDALSKEPHYILKYETNIRGYNMTSGGEGATGYKHSVESKTKIGLRSLGNKNNIGKSGDWSKSTEERENIRKRMSETWEITTPSGEIITISNLHLYCEQNNLQVGNMWKVSKGLRNHHKYYTCKKVSDGQH